MGKYCVVDFAYDLSQIGECTCDSCIRRFSDAYQQEIDRIAKEHVDLISGSELGTYRNINPNSESVSDAVWQDAMDMTDIEPHRGGDVD